MLANRLPRFDLLGVMSLYNSVSDPFHKKIKTTRDELNATACSINSCRNIRENNHIEKYEKHNDMRNINKIF